MKILADASLPGLPQAFPPPFKMTYYHQEQDIHNLLENQNILVCRSTLKVNKSLLKHANLAYIATASSGTDHIDVDYLNTRNIKLIDAKGCNATSVADYILSSVAYLQSVGIHPRKVAVIGLGQVGIKVISRLNAAGFEIIGYDPLLAKQNNYHANLESVFEADLICLHPNLHRNPPYPSFHLVNENFLKQLKKGTIIMNASRGDVVDEQALLGFRDSILYCTDVFSDEPFINRDILHYATLCTPHIAGHSIESKWEAVRLVSEQLHHAFELPHPQWSYPSVPEKPINCIFPSWQEIALNLYNPISETMALKKGADAKETFLKLRKSHVRHNFNALLKIKNLPLPFNQIFGEKV